MKNQILKSLSISAVMLFAVFTASVVVANGQSSTRVYAQIPFDFVVGDKTLSAGRYSVSTEMQDHSALRVRNMKANSAAVRLSDQIQSRSSKNNARLVFHRYGQTYFLAEVWQGGSSSGWSLHPSKAERTCQREQGSIAQNKYETVELMASLR
jgi:hypothetical protein